MPAFADTYTIDLREYVSPSLHPYSAIVQVGPESGACTGTLTADGVIVTAKHCVLDENFRTLQPKDLSVRHQIEGPLLLGDIQASGFDIYPNMYFDTNMGVVGDWALLGPRRDVKSDVRMAKFSGNMPVDVEVVGYGALKVLSDQEIQKIRQEYMKYLRGVSFANRLNPLNYFGGESFATTTSTGVDFINRVNAGQIPNLSPDIFQDSSRLKLSRCVALADPGEEGNLIDCQGWGGNSGGPVLLNLDGKWYLYGVAVAGFNGISTNKSFFAQLNYMVHSNKFWDEYNFFLTKYRKSQQERAARGRELKQILKEY